MQTILVATLDVFNCFCRRFRYNKTGVSGTNVAYNSQLLRAFAK